VGTGPEPITVVCCFLAFLTTANCKLRQPRLCAGRMAFLCSRFAMKTKPVVFGLLALFGVKITSKEERACDNISGPRLHKARVLSLQSKLKRMGCGWIVLNTEASPQFTSSCMTADVARLSVQQVRIIYDLCESQHCAQVSPCDCTFYICTGKTCLQCE